MGKLGREREWGKEVVKNTIAIWPITLRNKLYKSHKIFLKISYMYNTDHKYDKKKNICIIYKTDK